MITPSMLKVGALALAAMGSFVALAPAAQAESFAFSYSTGGHVYRQTPNYQVAYYEPAPRYVVRERYVSYHKPRHERRYERHRHEPRGNAWGYHRNHQNGWR